MDALSVQRAAIVDEAKTWIGTQYRHQGTLKGVGCDCLGLVRGVWRAVLGTEPQLPGPYSADWAESGGADALLNAARLHLASASNIEAGTVLLFRWRDGMAAKHLGIATGPDSFIHAYERLAVTQSPLGPHWKRCIAGIFDFPLNSKR